MKKSYLYLSVVFCSLVFASCSSDSDDIAETPKMVKMTFGVSTGDETTRAILHGKNIQLDAADHVSVFPIGYNNCTEFNIIPGTITTDDNKNWAKFTGKSYQVKTYFVLNPYQPDARLWTDTDGSNYITAVIPDEQHATKDSFDPRALIQTGEGTAINVNLKNTCALLKITTSEACKQITFKSSSVEDWYLAGKVNIKTATNLSAIPTEKSKGYLDGKTTVKLIPQEGKNTFEAGTYYISIAPTSPEIGGLTIEVTNADGNKLSNTTEIKYHLNGSYIWELGTVPTYASLQ